MKQLLRDIFYIVLTTLAALLWIPFTLILAIYVACREYRNYLSRCMQTMQIQKPDYTEEAL
jgi:hypothetical protein